VPPKALPPTHAGACSRSARRPSGRHPNQDPQLRIHVFALAATAASSLTNAGQSGLRSLAIAVGGGLDAVGAGVGIGMIFKTVIDSVTRQPEMRGEITSIQWFGSVPHPCASDRLR
jgi:F-type H+-transporting ATPase subunit c